MLPRPFPSPRARLPARRLASLLATGWLLVAACGGATASWAGERHEMRAPRMPMARAFGPGRAMRQEHAQRPAVREGVRPQNPPPAMSPAPNFAPLPFERPAERAPEAPVGKPGRLTPDERRALRQQINDAGRDIYRAPHP